MFIQEEIEGCIRTAADFGFSVNTHGPISETEARLSLEADDRCIMMTITPEGYRTDQATYEDLLQLMMSEVPGFPQLYARALEQRLDQL